MASLSGATICSAPSFACPDCKIGFEELEPRTFSFNSPYGACPTCEGLGVRETFDPELLVPDPSLSLGNGALLPLARLAGRGRAQAEEPVARLHGRERLPLEHPAGEA